MKNGIHWLAPDGTCTACGTAHAHHLWVHAQLAGIGTRPLTDWQAAMKAKIDAARTGQALPAT
jgi:hypothetical protein